MEVSDHFHAPAALSSGVRARDTYWIGGWVGPGARLDAVAKRKNPVVVSVGNRTPVVQPVA
jgi:hypothetical protein